MVVSFLAALGPTYESVLSKIPADLDLDSDAPPIAAAILISFYFNKRKGEGSWIRWQGWRERCCF